MTSVSVAQEPEVKQEEKQEMFLHPFTREELLDDLEYLADKAIKYARSKSSINTHQKINQIRARHGLDKRLL